ncbi:MAG: GNAT family N-acetyltransferase [Armatimonadota bacterium]|nr:MAG: GNAT family N-acetyltransferase [Armatimonadota bacterium]
MNGPIVRLRPITEGDLPNYVRWFNDPEVMQWLKREPGLTLEEEREWFAHISSPECKELVLAIEAEGRHIGGTGLHLRGDEQSAMFGIHIGEKSYWGKGYGTAATREMLRMGFAERGLHRIQLETWAHNVRARRCYGKCGFRYEGLRRRAILKAGEWIDVVTMAILREEWEALAAAPAADPCEPHIRGYRPTDYDEVADLWRSVGFHIRAGDSKEALDRKLARDPDLCLVAELGGRVVGTALGDWDGRRAWINRVAVHPDYQGRGVGQRLMGEAEARLAAFGAQRVALLTTADRPQAIRFYEDAGYEVRRDVAYLSKELRSEL